MKSQSDKVLFEFIQGDIRCAWDALSQKTPEELGNRGNFLFAFQVVVLLDWVYSFCLQPESDEQTSPLLTDFLAALKVAQPKYFTEVKGKPLLDIIWGSLRTAYKPATESTWDLGVQGVPYGVDLASLDKGLHLAYTVNEKGELSLVIQPGILLRDIFQAVKDSGILEKGDQKSRSYGGDVFTVLELEEALKSNGYARF